MKKIVFKIIYLLLFLFSAGSLIAFAFFSPEKDYSRILKCAVLTVGFGRVLFGGRRRSLKPNYRMYEETYKEFVRNAFASDKKSYRKLMEAIACYNRGEYKQGLRMLEKLVKKCSNNNDYLAVYMFQSLIYHELGQMEKVIANYEKILQYDMVNSTVWSNLGLCYQQMGRLAEAYEAYNNAIRYDPQDEMAYHNMSCYYLRQRDVQGALKYALLALERRADFLKALEVAAVANKLLGNTEAVEEYHSRYLNSGGEEKRFQEVLALF